MVRALAFNSNVMISAHKHTSTLLVWSKKNFKVLQEIPLVGIEGNECGASAIRVVDSSTALFWLEDGSIQVHNIVKNTQVKHKTTLNGHIQGCKDGLDVGGNELLSASTDGKVNLWDLKRHKLIWSNQR